jgi:hypothetical protein
MPPAWWGRVGREIGERRYRPGGAPVQRQQLGDSFRAEIAETAGDLDAVGELAESVHRFRQRRREAHRQALHAAELAAGQHGLGGAQGRGADAETQLDGIAVRKAARLAADGKDQRMEAGERPGLRRDLRGAGNAGGRRTPVDLDHVIPPFQGCPSSMEDVNSSSKCARAAGLAAGGGRRLYRISVCLPCRERAAKSAPALAYQRAQSPS